MNSEQIEAALALAWCNADDYEPHKKPCEPCTTEVRTLVPTVAQLVDAALNERLAAIKELLPEPRPAVISHPNGFSHGSALQCDQCPGFPHVNFVRRDALETRIGDSSEWRPL